MFEDVFCSLSYLFAVFYVDGRGGSTPLVRTITLFKFAKSLSRNFARLGSL